jgi:hypothetical protein
MPKPTQTPFIAGPLCVRFQKPAYYTNLTNPTHNTKTAIETENGHNIQIIELISILTLTLLTTKVQ